MKKIGILGICMILLFAVCAFSASAAVSVTSNFGDTSATFGGSDQKASNPDLDEDDSDREVYVTGTVGVSNNGTSTVTIDDIAVTYKMGFTAEDLNITLKEGATLNASSTGQVKLDARISEKLDAVNSKQEAVAFNVAEIKLKSGSTVVSTFNAYMQRKNQLVVDNVKIEVGDDSQTVDDGDNIEDIKPGDTVKLIVKAENKYRDSDDVWIDADDGKWEIGGDVDEEDDLDYGELDAKEEDELDFTFTIDEDVDEGSYDFDVYVSGLDQYDARHGERVEADFKVERERHEISILDISVVPDAASCGESVAVKVEIANLGKKNEDEAVIRIQNDDLKIDTMKTNIELDKGDTTTKTFELLIPENPESLGGKAFTVIAYYEMNEETDRDTFTVDVSCAAADDSDGDSSSDDDSQTQQQDTTTSTASSGGVATAEPTDASTQPTAPSPVTTVRSGDGFRDSSVYVILLILAIVIVVVVAAVLIAKAVMVK
jgi:hypothetical protein